MERRDYVAGGVEIEERSDGAKVLSGYAAVFYRDGDPGTQYELYSGMMERLSPGAFNRALQERQDVRALANHDPQQILGRSSAGTLRLSVDERGLRYEIDLPDTQAGRDMAVSIKRGDVTGSSFAFRPKKQTRQKAKDYDVRLLEDVDLFDVGPVTFPAYSSTSAGMRCHDPESVKRELDAEQATERRRKELDRHEMLSNRT
jgi:HK97 family phage prohead protease